MMKLIDLLVQELPKRGGWPEGAEYCWQDCDKEIRFDDMTFDLYADLLCENHRLANCANPDKESNISVTRQKYETALAASAWNGEGLPPVGTECEFKCMDEDWTKGKITYISQHTIVIELKTPDEDGDLEPAFAHEDMQFRPMRTEAECKREKTAQQMCDLFGNGIKIDEKEGYGTAWLEIYDAIAAGKIPGVKLTD